MTSVLINRQLHKAGLSSFFAAKYWYLKMPLTRRLPKILTTHEAQLISMAEAWLANGATAFEIIADDQVFRSWHGQGAGSATAVARAPINVDGTTVGELHVSGADDTGRLQVEADLLGNLIRLENELQLMTANLIDTQDQLLSFYHLVQAPHYQDSVRQALARLAMRVNGLFQVEGVLTLLFAEDWPLTIETHPTPLLQPDTVQRLVDRLQQNEHEILWQRGLHPVQEDLQLPSAIDNLLVVAAEGPGEVVVAIGLVNKQNGNITVPDVKLAHALAEHAGMQMENLILYQRTLQQARLQVEMELARNVQLKLLPRIAPHIEGLDLWGDSRPASLVGGDFYDYVSKPELPFTFTVGDVSGKGMSAALLMAMTRAVIRASIKDRKKTSPEAIINRVNTTLYRDFADVGMFTTIFLGQYVPQSRELIYTNAGHSPVIYCPAGEAARLVVADGVPMGVLSMTETTNQRLHVGPGDLLVVATDGFSEAWNDEDMFGYDRLLHLVEAVGGGSAQEIGRQLYEAVSFHSGERQQQDDQTLLVLKGVE